MKPEKEKAVILDAKAMDRAISRIAYEIIERNKGVDDLVLVGILTRGVQLSRRIAMKIKKVEEKEIPVGVLDITLYRDDLKKQEGYAEKTDIPFDITGKRIVVVDDVIYTGRSVRAAIDALMERGRPRNIQLAVLIDRGHRELPIRADFIGKNLPTAGNEEVKVYMQECDGTDKCAIYGRE